MPDPTSSRLSELVQSIEAAWADLHSFLAGLTDSQMTDVIDDQGWNIKDHITHMSMWEESVVFLFRGKPRHDALGIDQSLYGTASLDEINAIIRNQRKHISLTSAIGEFRKVHSGLMESIQTLSDTDLNEKVREFFPQPPANDDRRVVDIIYDNTTHHFLEHLSWMKALLNYQE
jgi:hypothetical protein